MKSWSTHDRWWFLLYYIVFTPEKCWVKKQKMVGMIPWRIIPRSQLVIRSPLWIHGILQGGRGYKAGGPLLDVDKEQWITQIELLGVVFLTFLSIWTCELLCDIVFPLLRDTSCFNSGLFPLLLVTERILSGSIFSRMFCFWGDCTLKQALYQAPIPV